MYHLEQNCLVYNSNWKNIYDRQVENNFTKVLKDFDRCRLSMLPNTLSRKRAISSAIAPRINETAMLFRAVSTSEEREEWPNGVQEKRPNRFSIILLFCNAAARLAVGYVDFDSADRRSHGTN